MSAYSNTFIARLSEVAVRQDKIPLFCWSDGVKLPEHSVMKKDVNSEISKAFMNDCKSVHEVLFEKAFEQPLYDGISSSEETDHYFMALYTLDNCFAVVETSNDVFIVTRNEELLKKFNVHLELSEISAYKKGCFRQLAIPCYRLCGFQKAVPYILILNEEYMIYPYEAAVGYIHRLEHTLSCCNVLVRFKGNNGKDEMIISTMNGAIIKSMFPERTFTNLSSKSSMIWDFDGTANIPSITSDGIEYCKIPLRNIWGVGYMPSAEYPLLNVW